MKESEILLVDDEEIVLARGRAMLKSEGYKVTTAESGEEAIKLLEKNTFDLVMADLAMGDVDGFAVVKKAKELYPETTTMVLTGSETTDFIIDALRIGVDDYMIKPNKTDDTLFRVLRCLEKHKANKERKQAEETLRESEEKLKSTISSMDDLVFVLDKNGVFSEYYRPSKEIDLYIPPEAFVGKSYREVMPPNFTQLLDAAISTVMSSGTVEQIEYSLEIQEETKWYSAKISPRKNASEESTGTTIVVRDTTERKQAEEALKQSEERMRILFEFAPDAYYISDKKGIFLDGNKAAEDMLGYKREELIGKSFLKLNILSFNQIPKAAALLLQSALKKPTGPDEFTLIRKDGSRVIVEIRTYPIVLEDKVMVLGIARDITKRKRAEEALRESEKCLNRAEKIARFGYWKLDPVTLEVEGSDELFRIFGLCREQATLEVFAEVVHPEDREYDLGTTQRGIDYGEDWDIEHRLLLKDGTEKVVHAVGEAITDETGKTVLLVGTVQDITERKKAEEEREKLISDLQAALAEIKTLSGIIPICAKCKKIRDDEGYWNPVEVYVRDHTEAEFSHACR